MLILTSFVLLEGKITLGPAKLEVKYHNGQEIFPVRTRMEQLAPVGTDYTLLGTKLIRRRLHIPLLESIHLSSTLFSQCVLQPELSAP